MISVVEQPCLHGLGRGPFRDPPGSSCLPPIIGRGVRRVFSAWAAIARLLRTWRMRELQRRELSTMSPRDFGDLAVPQSLAKEEIRRWPWQKSSPQWSQITNKRGGRYDDNGRTR
jgi:uncharacterized protein YjiS (DUF1127 family)